MVEAVLNTTGYRKDESGRKPRTPRAIPRDLHVQQNYVPFHPSKAPCGWQMTVVRGDAVWPLTNQHDDANEFIFAWSTVRQEHRTPRRTLNRINTILPKEERLTGNFWLRKIIWATVHYSDSGEATVYCVLDHFVVSLDKSVAVRERMVASAADVNKWFQRFRTAYSGAASDGREERAAWHKKTMKIEGRGDTEGDDEASSAAEWQWTTEAQDDIICDEEVSLDELCYRPEVDEDRLKALHRRSFLRGGRSR
ncbi:hypothetical protein LTR17_022929 [Elasticomyces elasticus]|nr:hypothetical protein LTR17_022929 [Elasticomyces elasticus]